MIDTLGSVPHRGEVQSHSSRLVSLLVWIFQCFNRRRGFSTQTNLHFSNVSTRRTLREVSCASDDSVRDGTE